MALFKETFGSDKSGEIYHVPKGKKEDKFKSNPFAKKYAATLKERRSSHDKALTKMAGKGNVLKGQNIEGKKK